MLAATLGPNLNGTGHGFWPRGNTIQPEYHYCGYRKILQSNRQFIDLNSLNRQLYSNRSGKLHVLNFHENN